MEVGGYGEGQGRVKGPKDGRREGPLRRTRSLTGGVGWGGVGDCGDST